MLARLLGGRCRWMRNMPAMAETAQLEALQGVNATGLGEKTGRTADQINRVRWLEERQSDYEQACRRLMETLGGVVQTLESCAVLAQSNQRLRQQLDGAVANLQETVRDLRRQVSPLGNYLPDTQDLAQGLKALADYAHGAAQVPVQTRVDGSVRHCLTAESARQVLHIVREALSNAVAHSGASRLALRASVVNRRFVVSVSDDGRGFNSRGAGAVGPGLLQMRSRTEAIGGMLQVESAPGAGTIITLTIPLDR